jgi:hypothetical protein
MFSEAAGKMVAKQIVTSEDAQQYAHALAHIEANQLDIAIRQAKAAGLEHPQREWSVEQRATVLLDIAQAVVSGTFREWWVETFGPAQFESVPPAKWVGAGTESDLWQSQVGKWASRVRERYPDLEATDRELASVACKNVYSVPLEEMEQTVVEMDRGAEVRRRFGGNFATAQQLHEQVTKAIEAGEVEV